MSDIKVLSYLVCNRSKLDASYIEKIYPSGTFFSSGTIVFNESVLAVYVDLDRLIESSGLTAKQRGVINLLMRGYSIQDIADETGKEQSAISHLLRRSLEKMSRTHEERWRQVMHNLYGTEGCGTHAEESTDE